VGWGKTLVKEKRLFYYPENLHKIFYTTQNNLLIIKNIVVYISKNNYCLLIMAP